MENEILEESKENLVQHTQNDQSELSNQIDSSSKNSPQHKEISENFKNNNDLTSEEVSLRHVVQENNTSEILIEEEPISLNENFINGNAHELENMAHNNQNMHEIQEELYRHNLNNLVENLNNLRDLLQNIVSTSGLNNQFNNIPNDQNINQEGFNNVPVDDQLQNLRRLLIGNQQFNENNIENVNLNQPQNEPNPFIQEYAMRIKAYITEKIKDFRFLLTLFGISSIFLLLIGYSISPNFDNKPKHYLIEWLSNHKNSGILLIGASLTMLTGILKFLEFLFSFFLPDESQKSFKMIFDSLTKYSPFYDLGFYLIIDNTIVQDKFEFSFIFGILAWNLISTKVIGIAFDKLSKIMFSITHSPEREHAKIRKIQQFGAVILVLNLMIASGIIWLCWYANFKIIASLTLIFGLSLVEPFKLFLSSSISLKNYSLITNNNVIHLNDPKFKTETILDIIYQCLIIAILLIIGYSSSKYIMGFIIIYFSSFYNSVGKLRDALKKIQKWRIINKKLDEIYPIVDRKDQIEEENCTICHENMLVARKLPCGHIFHAKCLIFWLENQKTCPNCRAAVPSLSDLISQPNNSVIRNIFNSIRHYLRI